MLGPFPWHPLTLKCSMLYIIECEVRDVVSFAEIEPPHTSAGSHKIDERRR